MTPELYTFFQQFVISFTAVFVAIDAIGIVPIFLSLTQNLSREDRAATVKTSVMVAFIVAMVFLFLGSHVFKLMGISVSDFKVAGGIVILLVALSDLLKGPQGMTPVTGSTGIVPLAVPLITGPGVITTVVLQANSVGYLIVVLSLMVNFFLAWIFLSRAQKVSDLIGRDGTVIVSKIEALLLCALGIAMIRTGIYEFINTRG